MLVLRGSYWAGHEIIVGLGGVRIRVDFLLGQEDGCGLLAVCYRWRGSCRKCVCLSSSVLKDVDCTLVEVIL